MLKLYRFKENLDSYLDMIADSNKIVLEFKNYHTIKDCVKVTNFLYLKEINEFDFRFQQSLYKTKIIDIFIFTFINERLI